MVRWSQMVANSKGEERMEDTRKSAVRTIAAALLSNSTNAFLKLSSRADLESVASDTPRRLYFAYAKTFANGHTAECSFTIEAEPVEPQSAPRTSDDGDVYSSVEFETEVTWASHSHNPLPWALDRLEFMHTVSQAVYELMSDFTGPMNAVIMTAQEAQERALHAELRKNQALAEALVRGEKHVRMGVTRYVQDENALGLAPGSYEVTNVKQTWNVTRDTPTSHVRLYRKS